MEINRDTIIKDDNPLIREKSLPVEMPLSKEDESLIIDMLKYVKESKVPEIAEKNNLRAAVGMSAVQVGVLKRIFVIDVETDEDKDGNPLYTTYALVNPRIVTASAKQAYLKSGEGCLSIEEDYPGYVARSYRVKVEGYDYLQNKMVTIRAEGYLAIVLQHELDHFEGILFYDRINKLNPNARIRDAIVIE